MLGASVIAAVIAKGAAAAIYQFFSAEQLLVLMACINIPVMPGKLISLYEGFAVFTFQLIPNFFQFLPFDEINAVDDSRALVDNSQYHPDIFEHPASSHRSVST